MNITLAIPRGKDVKRRIEKEYSLASNIKAKHDRDSVQQGLRKILEQVTDGRVYLWNGDTLESFEYPLDSYIYYCHPTLFKVPEVGVHNRYLLVALDTKSAAIGMLEGSRLTTLWKDDSGISGKHSNGGQSAPRYMRLRQEFVKQWYRKIMMRIKEIVYT